MSAADNKAVFLSYASQDAEPARKICAAHPLVFAPMSENGIQRHSV